MPCFELEFTIWLGTWLCAYEDLKTTFRVAAFFFSFFCRCLTLLLEYYKKRFLVDLCSERFEFLASNERVAV